MTGSQDLSELLERVEGATGADRELDEAIALLIGGVSKAPSPGFPSISWYAWPDGDGDPMQSTNVSIAIKPFTASLDAALALVERVLPGCWYVLGKGKLKASEPLYGAKLLFSSEGVLGEGEHEHSQALALLAALLKAHQAQASDTQHGSQS